MNKDDEKVLVVPADIIFSKGRWQGLKRDNLDYYLELIKNSYQFKRRGDVETDPLWQQIIPYIVFSHQDKFFIYKYLTGAGEQRLHDTYQIGVAGHINQIDVNGGDVLEEGMMREWNEEVDYRGNFLERKLVGILNDDESGDVEKVHLGMVYSFVGDSPEISIKEKEKMQGEMVDKKNIADYIKNTKGGWIQIVYKEYLLNL
jgi:predicted NUDIX family phosphoesterase